MSHLSQPDWIRHWTTETTETTPDPVTVHAIITCVRDGNTLEETEAVTGLTRPQIFPVVAAVGARCTQIAKSHTRAATIAAGEPGAPARVTSTKQGPAVVAAGGWVRSRREGDIRKSYTATILAETDVVAAAIARYTDNTRSRIPVNYTHFADLHGAARGVLPPLHEVVASPTAAAAYVQAWTVLDSTVARAVTATAELLRNPTPQAVVAATKTAFWLLPNATGLHHWANLCVEAKTLTSRNLAEQQLRNQLVGLRKLAVKQPARLAPTRLEQLTVTQMRAIAALHGHHPTDGAAARTETLYEEFATAAKSAIREHRDTILA